MLAQQLISNLRDSSGSLTITAPAGELVALQELAIELSGRANIRTNGDVTVLPTEQPPPMEEDV